MSSQQPAPRRFLPEVQALRALAVLVVVAYHLEPRVVPGGFVGVDVFFVISGFLITGHLVREARRAGRISLPGFWAGRVRRILPAALTAIAAVVVGTLVFAPVTQWGTIGQQALASVFSVQNWVLAADSVDYLAAENPPTALQHFWSLGVEEQFYLLWPLLVVLALLLGRATIRGSRRSGGPRGLRPGLLALFGTVTLASLAYSMWLTAAGDPAAYFVTPTRMWELGIGGLLAVVMAGRADGAPARVPRVLASPGMRSLLVLAGLAGIGYAVIRYDGGTPFPGFAAALPVLGTAAVILAGRTSGPLSLNWLSDHLAIQWVGNVSYSLYLWHWPILTFFILIGDKEPRPLESVGLLGISLVAAWLSYRFIETPARTFRPLASSNIRALAVGAAAIVLAAVLALVPTVGQQQVVAAENGQIQQLRNSPPAGFGAASIETGAAFASANHQIVPTPASAHGDYPDLGSCVSSGASHLSHTCEFGAKKGDAKFTIALVGDSHATQWWKALEPMAKKHNWRIVTHLKNSCPFTGAVRTAQKVGFIDCVDANKDRLDDLVADQDIDAVFIAGWTGAPIKGGHEAATQGAVDYWGKVQDSGKQVIVVRDSPNPSQDPLARDCVAKHADDLRQCGKDRDEALSNDDWISAAQARDPRLELLDFTDEFCTQKLCPAVVGNVLVYRDQNHISDTYMATIAPAFEQQLSRALRGSGLAGRAGLDG
ncbi:acyltransferase family protein [Arthrobacter sp.]|uniref:acyltransferase family protein n=1 Tax=Arthrobacter sp. TaxID=1667 RepID=UPI003A8E9E23